MNTQRTHYIQALVLPNIALRKFKSAQISANDVMLLQYPWATVLKHKEGHRSLEQHFG